jgi:hypothetical protein
MKCAARQPTNPDEPRPAKEQIEPASRHSLFLYGDANE